MKFNVTSKIQITIIYIPKTFPAKQMMLFCRPCLLNTEAKSSGHLISDPGESQDGQYLNSSNLNLSQQEFHSLFFLSKTNSLLF